MELNRNKIYGQYIAQMEERFLLLIPERGDHKMGVITLWFLDRCCQSSHVGGALIRSIEKIIEKPFLDESLQIYRIRILFLEEPILQVHYNIR